MLGYSICLPGIMIVHVGSSFKHKPLKQRWKLIMAMLIIKF